MALTSSVNTFSSSLALVKADNKSSKQKTWGVADNQTLFRSKDFILGGISIDSEYEVVAHSDGDIISHAIIDALLGASKMGDIGKLAPSNEENKDISSIHLLKKVTTMLLEAGYQIVNIDLTYVGEEPRLEKFKKKNWREFS